MPPLRERIWFDDGKKENLFIFTYHAWHGAGICAVGI